MKGTAHLTGIFSLASRCCCQRTFWISEFLHTLYIMSIMYIYQGDFRENNNISLPCAQKAGT